jgi:hypothetical protein
MVFAKETTTALTGLVKKLDAATVKNRAAHLAAFVVVYNDDKALEEKLKKLAAQERIEHAVLTLDADPAGPKAMKLAKDADVTVVLYVHKKAKANFTFKKGELTEKDADRIVADLATILTKDASE